MLVLELLHHAYGQNVIYCKKQKRINQFGFDHIFVAVFCVVVIGLFGAGYVVLKGHSAKGTSHAAAGYGNQFCTTNYLGHTNLMCLNAWGGGPWVNVYTHLGTINNDFTLGKSNSYWSLSLTGGTNIRWIDQCIGDAYDNAGSEETSLDPCPHAAYPGHPAYNGGWGTNFIPIPCTGGYEFKNVHWTDDDRVGNPNLDNRWLAPNGWGNNANFVLNSPKAYCFKKYGAA
jgi:hypothetical protein